MTCMSAWFYGMFGLWPLLIIFGTILWNYMISLAADRLQRKALRRSRRACRQRLHRRRLPENSRQQPQGASGF